MAKQLKDGFVMGYAKFSIIEDCTNPSRQSKGDISKIVPNWYSGNTGLK